MPPCTPKPWPGGASLTTTQSHLPGSLDSLGLRNSPLAPLSLALWVLRLWTSPVGGALGATASCPRVPAPDAADSSCGLSIYVVQSV